MPPPIRFHLDEHLATAVAEGLRRRGIDVTRSPEAGLLGASDETQLSFATSENRVLVTRDPDFLDLHRQGVEHAGIAFSSQPSRLIGDLVRSLLMLWECMSPEDMRNHVEFL
jgi:uncharacterized protein with PIN domain